MVTKVKGLELKIIRLRVGIRQYDLAARLGILPNRLSEIESGRREPSPELLTQLLQILNQAKKVEADNEG